MEMNKVMSPSEISEASVEIPGTLGVYSIYDNLTQAFDTPFFAHTDLFAGRHYMSVLNDPGTIPSKFKTEFDLYRLGTWNKKTGDFDTEKTLILKGKDD